MPTLTDEKDPLVVELERIVTTQLARPTTFMHANRKEANLGLDQMEGEDVKFPVFLLVATGKSKNKFNEAGVIQRTATVYGLLLEQVSNPTSDYTTEEVSTITNKMRELGENLAYYLNKSPLAVNGGVDEWECVDVYAQFDAHLFGVALSFTWTIDTGRTGYLKAYNTNPPHL